MIILQTENFTIQSHEKPFVSREEGGHIVIRPILEVEDRTKLSPELAKELMKLTMVVGEAMKRGMQTRGIELGRINYLELGNWTPILHIHVIGRAKTATKQKFGEALSLPFRNTGFYDDFKPLDEEDITIIKKQIERLLLTEKYHSF